MRSGNADMADADYNAAKANAKASEVLNNSKTRWFKM